MSKINKYTHQILKRRCPQSDITHEASVNLDIIICTYLKHVCNKLKLEKPLKNAIKETLGDDILGEEMVRCGEASKLKFIERTQNNI
jgi:hypothetical protein